MNKKKIFNDPVYGFVTMPAELLFDLIEHPYFSGCGAFSSSG